LVGRLQLFGWSIAIGWLVGRLRQLFGWSSVIGWLVGWLVGWSVTVIRLV
jgi:hypothetical protein